MIRDKQRQISDDVYFRAMLNGGRLTESDKLLVFTDAERLGYGAIIGSVFTDQYGKPYVNYSISDSCD